MRLKSADQSLITDVSRLRPYRCTIITSMAPNTVCGGRTQLWRPRLTRDIRAKLGATLQPEAAGAAMEVTKWLKPSESVSRIGDSASVQAVTRVNAEQASKRTMRRPTRRPFRGRLTRLGLNERRSTPSRCAGVVATACTQGKRTQHGKPHGVVRATTNWKPARDRPGALGWRRGS